jgi:hypothetical protein
VQPAHPKIIKQRSSTLGLHLEAWHDASPPSLWAPPQSGCITGNFDVAVRDSFVVAATVVISEYSINIILAASYLEAECHRCSHRGSYICFTCFLAGQILWF